MPGILIPNVGMPGVQAETIAGPERRVSANGFLQMVPVGRIWDGAKARDPNNGATNSIRAGTLIGKITASGKYANSVIGTTSTALAGAGTSVTIAIAEAVELARRLGGSTGNVTITGPNQAGLTVVQRTMAITAINQSSGVLTVTALGNVNQVERIKFNAPSTAGNIQLTIQKTDGTFATTANAAWNATDATYLAAINTQLDASTGVAGGIVATAIAGVDPDNGIQLTYSGTGYAGKSWTPAVVAVFPTGSTVASYEPFTSASGSFIAGSLIGDTDGSQTPLSFVPDGYPAYIPSDSSDAPLSYLPAEGMVDATQLLPWPADTALQAWVKARIKDNGLFSFTNAY